MAPGLSLDNRSIECAAARLAPSGVKNVTTPAPMEVPPRNNGAQSRRGRPVFIFYNRPNVADESAAGT